MRCASFTIFAFGALVSAMPMPYAAEGQQATLERRSSSVPEAHTLESPSRQFAYPSLVDFWNKQKTQGEPHASPDNDDSVDVDTLSWTSAIPTPQDSQDHDEVVAEPLDTSKHTQASSPQLASRAVPPMPYSRDYIQYTWKRASPQRVPSEHPTRPATSRLLRAQPSYRWATVGDLNPERRDGVGSLTVEDMISANALAGRRRRGDVSDVVKLRRKDWRLRVKGARLIEV